MFVATPHAFAGSDPVMVISEQRMIYKDADGYALNFDDDRNRGAFEVFARKIKPRVEGAYSPVNNKLSSSKTIGVQFKMSFDLF